MRHVAAAIGALLVSVACTTPDAGSVDGASPRTTSYHDPSGWTIDVPIGWSVVPFDSSAGEATAEGAQISNTRLPAPEVVPGFPMQTSELVLPRDGLTLVISIDSDPDNVQEPPDSPQPPPLSLDAFMEGSASPGGASLGLLWFSGDGSTFLATTKTGADASAADRRLLAQVVGSLRFTDRGEPSA